MEENKKVLVYASFWDRLVAVLIDWIILIIPTWFVGTIIPIFGHLLVLILYKVVFECSAARATPGKRIMKLEVVTLQGETISFKTSFVRFAVSFVSASFAFLGYLLALVTEKRQTLHDLIAETLVVEGTESSELFQSWADKLKALFGMAQAEITATRKNRTEMEKLQLLEKLHELRKNGAISEEEYLRRKSQLLETT